MRRVILWSMSLLLLLAFPAFAQDATEEATEPSGEATALPQEATTEPGEPTAYYRFANFAPGAVLAFTLDDQPTNTTGLEYKVFSDWMKLPPGKHTVVVNSTGDNTTQSEPADLDFADGGWYTLAGQGTPQGALNVESIDETFDPLLPGTSWITLVNAVQGGANVDFVRDGSTYTANLFPLGNEQNETSWFGIMDDVGTYDLKVVENLHPETALVENPSLTLRENEMYLIAAVGTTDPNDTYDVELLVENTGMAEVELVRGDMQPPGSILEAAAARPELAPFLAALERAGLADTLKEPGPFTVFAPADFVFDNFPDSLESDPTKLAEFLRSHIVDGDMRLQDLFNTGTLTTLAGNQLKIEQRGENAFVNDAQLINVNIPATNGVIHVINNFAIPAQ